MDDVLTLIETRYTIDDTGVEHAVEAPRDVFCRVGSVTRSEFFAGGRAGLNPEFVFTVFRADYLGEEIVSFHDRRYAIYRTYLTPDSDHIELYAERKGGTNGAKSNC